MGLLRDILSTIREPPPPSDTPDLETLLLHEIGRAMSGSMEGVDETLSLICEAVTTLLRVEKCLLLHHEPNLGRLALRTCRGMVEPAQLGERDIPPGVGLIGRSIAEARAMVGDAGREGDRESLALYSRLDLHYFLVAPLQAKDTTLGVLIADSPTDGRAFDSRDIHRMEVLANLAAITETNAQLISTLKARAQGLQALSEISQALVATRDTEALLGLIQVKALELTRAKSCAILLVNEDDGQLDIRSTLGMDKSTLISRRLGPGEGISGWALLTGKTILVPDVSKDPRYIEADLQAKSELAVPMRIRGNVIGILAVDAHTLDAFTPLDQQLLEAFAAHAAISLDNAREFERLEPCDPQPI